MYLTPEELAQGAATQDAAWMWDHGAHNSTQRNAPVDLAEDEGAADHLPTNPEGG